ncbi:MAG TPA: SNF2-related protein [Pseudomonadota bacterium]|nr:SNF2-related protein [Pseudomonadota bacterium]
MSLRYAERGVRLLQAALQRQPPPGVTTEFVGSFFQQFGPSLQGELAKLLDAAWARRQPDPVVPPPLPPEGMPPDEWPAAARTAANIEAISLIASSAAIGPGERSTLLRYSGWGGLSLDAAAAKIPPGWLPESRGLIHEFYTPTRVAREIARVLLPLLSTLPHQDGRIQALEPSAGIGRLVHACSRPGFEALAWTAVEFSQVSARLLAAVRPDLTIYEGPLERWLVHNEAEVRGKLGLVVSNPPYGVRGATFTEDANKAYREHKAYLYFLRRCLDLLALGGIGVFLIPYGFLTGQSGALHAVRQKVLRRHHLMTAFRLPSRLFPGANLVTDLLFFRARGGELSEVLPEDQPVLQGKYFQLFPQHILGTERGKAEDEDDTTRKPRRGYEVDGEFTTLPDFTERPMCTSCAVVPIYTAADRLRKKPTAKESLPASIQAAITLGERVGHFLTLRARGDDASTRTAAALYHELRDALAAWNTTQDADKPDRPYSEQEPAESRRSQSPYADRMLQREAKNHPELVAFLSAFEESGELAAAFRTPPVYVPRYQGELGDLGAQADFLYRTRRHLTLEALREFRRELGVADLNEPLHTRLISAGWCFDSGQWLPARDYYTGSLWPRYDRAKALADQGDAQAAAQAARLLEVIRPVRFSDIAPEPRMPWVPIEVLRAWLEEWTDAAVPVLVRDNGLLRLEESTYTHLKEVAEQRLSVVIGYLNHDFALFRPPVSRQVNPATGEEESAEQALSRARVEYGDRARRSFHDFIAVRPELMEQLEESYIRVFRGYVTPEYGTDELPIARWRGRIVLKPHQRAGAQRLIANGGGLLGFDVGVGKTYTGIATIAATRQAGRAKHPVVVVPNTIIWKWAKEIRTALPDYRVVIIGSERYLGRSGVYTSRIDTPQERAMKWRQFQAGEFDLALVTYSVFARNRVRAESVRQWILQTPALLRQIGLDARNLLAGLKERPSAAEARPRKKKVPAQVSEAVLEKLVGAERARTLSEEQRTSLVEKIALEREQAREAENERLLKLVEALTDLSERERAIFHEAMERWIAERLEMNDEPDPGIYWEDLQCDLLVLDEAQNMKNLWPVQQREGGVPKYLGAITEGSDRAWNFAIRAALVPMQTGGSGVVLLSATPAKNSPLEYYTLLGYVDGEAWSRLGITDPEVFIDRYLRLELKEVIGSDLKTQRRSVVAGFQNLDELRDVVFRYAEFRTAEEVGLKLPETQVEQIRVPMSQAQADKYDGYLLDYEQAIKRSREDPKMRLKALGLLQRMALVAIHPELDAGPLNKDGKGEWTWQNARQVRDPSCPKLVKVRDLILEKPDCGHLVFCDNVAVHFWLKELLAQGGFPEGRIAIFNADQAPSPMRRQLLAERFNGVAPVLDDKGQVEQEGIPPQYDVVIANATAYEGIDLHVRTCQVYHIDLPWEPATLQQRNGRAVRQGNMQAVIRILYLLSERSMDAVRFSMILGKLNWMKDILKSADRETNNPGAQAEMNPEELLLYLARDPDQARAAIEQQKKMLAEESRQRVRRQAWTSLRGIATRAQSLGRVTDETQKAQIQHEMEELRGYLAQVPAETWPWFHFADIAQSGTPMLFGADWALYQGGAVFREGEGFEMGEVRADDIGVRRFGDFVWHPLSVEKLSAPEPPEVLRRIKVLLDQATPEDYRLAFARWPLVEDRERFDLSLRRAIASLRSGDFAALGLGLASPSWRQWLWEQHSGAIVAALGQAPDSMPFKVPTASTGATAALSLRTGSELAGHQAEVIPFLAELFPRLTDLAPMSGYKWSELQATALAWWGRSFPRGILRDADSGAVIEIRTSEGIKKVRAVWQSPHFAVTYAQGRGPDHPDGPLYNVTHLASGAAAAQSFLSVDSARAAAQYLGSLQTNWESPEPDTGRLPRSLSATLAWVRSKKEAPSLAEIEKRAAG